MRIAAHNGARLFGGAERATVRLLAGLQARGHSVRLFCNDPLVAQGATSLGVAAEILPLGGDVAVHDALRLARELRRSRPDALLLGTFKKLWLGALAARLAGVPRVVARVGLETDTPRSWKYRAVLARWVDRVVVNADRIRPAFLALPGWTEERVTVVYNGVEEPPLHGAPGELRRALGIPADAPVVGAIARLAEQKRLDRMLRLVAQLPSGVHCVLAGDGELRGELEGLAGELEIQGRVHFLGHREDVGDVLDALDVYLVTSDREGMSNSMLEALAAGVPVVSTPVSGAPEALEPLPDGRVPGRLADFSVASLRAAVEPLLGDAALRAEMSAAARERARERFGFQAMLDRWERVLAGSPA